MTREQFLNFVRQPDLVASYSADELQKLVNQFPYCQPLRILQLRHLKDNNSILYSQKLKVTAAFAPDRIRLYQLMHNQDSAIITNNEYSLAEIEKPLLENIRVEIDAEEIVENSITEQIKEPELSPQEIVENRLKELHLLKETPEEKTALLSQITLPEETTISNEITEVILAPEDNDPLEELILEAITETKNNESGYFTAFGLSDEENNTTELDQDIDKSEQEINSVEIKINEVEQRRSSEEEEIDDEENVSENKISILKKDEVPVNLAGNSQEEPYLSEVDEVPSSTVSAKANNPSELITPKEREAHSFAEWLHLNHPDEENENQAKTSREVVVAKEKNEEKVTAAGIKETIATKKKEEEIDSNYYEQPAAYIIEKSESAQKEKEEIQQEETAKSTVKVLYVKRGITESVAERKSVDEIQTSAREIYRSPLQEIKAAITETPDPENPNNEPQPTSIRVPDSAESNTGPSLRTNRELGLKEVIKPSKKAKKNRNTGEDKPSQIEKKTTGKNEQTKIIEQFIQQAPRITPMKAYNNPVNMAKKSVQETNELVTETLAAIYAQQGNLEKAISFYEKLSLKIPEKSAYFAALIKDLKNKLNS